MKKLKHIIHIIKILKIAIGEKTVEALDKTLTDFYKEKGII